LIQLINFNTKTKIHIRNLIIDPLINNLEAKRKKWVVPYLRETY